MPPKPRPAAINSSPCTSTARHAASVSACTGNEELGVAAVLTAAVVSKVIGCSDDAVAACPAEDAAVAAELRAQVFDNVGVVVFR